MAGGFGSEMLSVGFVLGNSADCVCDKCAKEILDRDGQVGDIADLIGEVIDAIGH